MGSLDYCNWSNATTTAADDSSIFGTNIVYNVDYSFGNLSLTPKKEKTNLDWLDSRVNEMRVKL